ncbi:MAG: 3-hydroxyacyl-CoA dehydrogenase NAD-binding domain-containing protein [Bacteroidia bacterium]
MKIGVIGAGSMGSGIAQLASSHGHEVFLFDQSEESLDKARAKIRKILNRLVEKGKIEPSQADGTFNRIHPAFDYAQLSDCSLVIEAVVERLDVKQKIFRKLEEFIPQNCILATNTSSLSVAAIAAACELPERVMGIHFFNPAPLMRLVEIVPALQTDPEAVKAASEIIQSWGKITVVTKDTPGFIVNRVARPFYGEALRILEEGIADVATIDWAMTDLGGFRMGPFTLMDYIGNDVNYIVTETVFTAFYFDPRYKPAFTQKRLAEAGYLGRKSGRGYYEYGEDAERPLPNLDVELGQKVADRIITMLINEAADAFFWQIASAEDIDLAMTKGVNYPQGLLAWADEIGIAECVLRMDTLYHEYREDRYRCSPLLRRMARNNETFFN